MNFDLMINRNADVQSYLNSLFSYGFVPQTLRRTRVADKCSLSKAVYRDRNEQNNIKFFVL